MPNSYMLTLEGDQKYKQAIVEAFSQAVQEVGGKLTPWGSESDLYGASFEVPDNVTKLPLPVNFEIDLLTATRGGAKASFSLEYRVPGMR